MQDIQDKSCKFDLWSTIDKDSSDMYELDGSIDSGTAELISNLVDANEDKKSRAALVLTTSSGDWDAAYLLATKLLREYVQMVVYVPVICGGPGILFAIAAHRFVMDTDAVLQPRGAFNTSEPHASLNRTYQLMRDDAAREATMPINCLTIDAISLGKNMLFQDKIAAYVENLAERGQNISVDTAKQFVLASPPGQLFDSADASSYFNEFEHPDDELKHIGSAHVGSKEYTTLGTLHQPLAAAI